MNSQISDEEEILRERRRQRIIEARRRKKRQELHRKLMKTYAVPIAGACVIVVLLLVAGGKLFSGASEGKNLPSENMKVQGEDGGQGNFALNGGGDGLQTVDPGAGGVGGGTSGSSGLDGAGNGVSGSVGTAEIGSKTPGSEGTDGAGNPGAAGAAATGTDDFHKPYSAHTTNTTRQLGEDITSSHAVLIDLEGGEILAQKDASSRISPASMTKMLTVLVAAEHVENLDDTFTITLDITDYSYVNDCSSAGFAENETVTVRDLFYGTILPSGADAAAALATYVAGSKEAFVDMMNDKLEELGISGTTHMTNCVGLYDEAHYSTVYDMAVIIEAAISNSLCREVMSAHTYTTSATPQHPEGLLLSNWFLRRIEDKDTGGEVICAKTGYVVQSGNCAASYAADKSGKEFLCVTAGATSAWRCIYDHVALYKQFASPDI